MKRGSIQWYVEMTKQINDNICEAKDMQLEMLEAAAKRKLYRRLKMSFKGFDTMLDVIKIAIEAIRKFSSTPFPIKSKMRGADYIPLKVSDAISKHNRHVGNYPFSALGVPKKYFGSK